MAKNSLPRDPTKRVLERNLDTQRELQIKTHSVPVLFWYENVSISKDFSVEFVADLMK